MLPPAKPAYHAAAGEAGVLVYHQAEVNRSAQGVYLNVQTLKKMCQTQMTSRCVTADAVTFPVRW